MLLQLQLMKIWDQLIFHVGGKKKRQQRRSFLLALSKQLYGQQSVVVVKASYFLFLIYTPDWKLYSQLKTYNFLRFKPQENKWSAVSSSHIINSKSIPFLHGCYYSVVTKCTSHNTLENATGLLTQLSPLLTVTEYLTGNWEVKPGSNKILRARENFGTQILKDWV